MQLWGAKKKMNTRFIKLANCDAAALRLRLRRWCEFYFYKEDSRRYFSQVKICDYVIAVATAGKLAQINTQSHTHTLIYECKCIRQDFTSANIFHLSAIFLFWAGRGGVQYKFTHTQAHTYTFFALSSFLIVSTWLSVFFLFFGVTCPCQHQRIEHTYTDART